MSTLVGGQLVIQVRKNFTFVVKNRVPVVARIVNFTPELPISPLPSAVCGAPMRSPQRLAKPIYRPYRFTTMSAISVPSFKNRSNVTSAAVEQVT